MKWKYPREGVCWSKCQTCGTDHPSPRVMLNPRYGWQCPECWDGLIQRDQIMQPIFPGEGTRKTLGPITNTATEGVGQYDATITVYDRGADGRKSLYDFQFGDFISFNTSVSGNSPMGGIILNNGWILYIQDGFLSYGQVPVPDAYPWSGKGSLSVDPDGFLDYVPYVQTIVSA